MSSFFCRRLRFGRLAQFLVTVNRTTNNLLQCWLDVRVCCGEKVAENAEIGARSHFLLSPSDEMKADKNENPPKESSNPIAKMRCVLQTVTKVGSRTFHLLLHDIMREM